MLKPALGLLDTRSALPPPKTADAELLTQQHRAFRRAVLERAKWQCEEIINGQRCPKRAPKDMLYADHVTERKDGGNLFDPNNGKALCASHHTTKTNAERSTRTRARPQQRG